MYAHAIAQVEPPEVGIHLLWTGPNPWLYSQEGWSIQRREYKPYDPDFMVENLNSQKLAELRQWRERDFQFGTMTLSDGIYPLPLVGQLSAATLPCEIFTFELKEPQSCISLAITAQRAFGFGLREGKVVAVGPDTQGQASWKLHAIAIDTVVVYAISPSYIVFSVHIENPESAWDKQPFLVEALQLPLQGLIPGLRVRDELEVAVSRLLPGETLDRKEFERIADILRQVILHVGPPRPIDLALLLRENKKEERFEEMNALDPLRIALIHPKWRRVLGFGWFDNDAALQDGKQYEYRLTGTFPGEDLNDAVYGFHTIPSQTMLPAQFYLNDLCLSLPQPAKVERAPDTPATGSSQISRRGIPLTPKKEHFWPLLPDLEDLSLAIDFPTPTPSVILELHEHHQLEYKALAPSLGSSTDFSPIQQGSHIRLDFPFPAEYLWIKGSGFLFAIRIPQGEAGFQTVSAVLPPVMLKNTPRPEPPLTAVLTNLQQPVQIPVANTTPKEPQPRHNLGFQITWRPSLKDGLTMWPSEEKAAAPLEANIYQIEHRQIDMRNSFSPATLKELGARGQRFVLSGQEEKVQEYPESELLTASRECTEAGYIETGQYHLEFSEPGEGAPLGTTYRVVKVLPGAWASKITRAFGWDRYYSKEQAYGAYNRDIIFPLDDDRETFNPDEIRPGQLLAVRIPPREDGEKLPANIHPNMTFEERERLLTAGIVADREALARLSEESAQLETGWSPLMPDENWIFGNRDHNNAETRPYQGCNLMDFYPEGHAAGSEAQFDVYWQDAFNAFNDHDAIQRPVPEPGTYHQYRIRTVDLIGRPGLTWRTTPTLRLEKHLPPPVPVGPDETPPHEKDDPLPSPTGVHARILVKGDPDLTSEEKTTLGNHNNMIILHWGWHERQREQDLFVKEFRIYVSQQPLDSVRGELLGYRESGPGIYLANLKLEREIEADIVKGSYLQAGGTFYIVSHSKGKNITAYLQTRIPISAGVYAKPVIGPIELPLPLTPKATRQPAWTTRYAVKPLTTEETYTESIADMLNLSPQHPRDCVWVGVSAADDQWYIADQLAPADNRPGNESGIVSVICHGRYYGRPQFNIPPKMEKVPVVITPEPEARPVVFELDLKQYLKETGLASGDKILTERAAADIVFASYYTQGDKIMARVIDKQDDSEHDTEIVVDNISKDDRKAIIAALNNADTGALEDCYVVFLAGSHPYADRMFERVVEKPLAFADFEERLPPKSGRYVYRVRKADAAGHVSMGCAMAQVVVRVPSLARGPVPQKLPKQRGDAPETLRLRIAPTPHLSHVLVFSQIIATGNTGAAVPAEGAELLRISNRPDLYKVGAGIQICAPDGAIITPQSKALSDADVHIDQDGFHEVDVALPGNAGEVVRVWTCTFTRDGIPSMLGGPWSVIMPAAAILPPHLNVMGPPPTLIFSWNWQTMNRYTVALEHSLDGVSWKRISPILQESVTGYTYSRPTSTEPSVHYRLRVVSPDGRSALSNVVTV